MLRHLLIATLLFAGAPAGADEPEPVGSNLEPCHARLLRAREELLAAHFDPAIDTAGALQVAEASGAITLSAHVAAASDSLHESYVLTVEPTAAGKRARWTRTRQRVCCDDWAEEEDHVTAVAWTRRSRRWSATVETVTGRYPSRPRWVALFTSIARRAADACLAAR